MKIELLLLCVKDHGDYPTQPASHLLHILLSYYFPSPPKLPPRAPKAVLSDLQAWGATKYSLETHLVSPT